MRDLDLIRPPRPKQASDFSVSLLGGETLRLKAQRGKPVMVNFWATWCAPCREEMPAMERLYLKHRERGFVLLAVSVDSDASLVKPFLEKLKLTFPVTLDAKMDLANCYGRPRAAGELPHRSRRLSDGAGARPARLGQPRRARARRRDARAMTGESLGFAVAFTAGLFSFLSPCVLPLFPSYVSFITGMSVADLTADLSAGGAAPRADPRGRLRPRLLARVRRARRLVQRRRPVLARLP